MHWRIEEGGSMGPCPPPKIGYGVVNSRSQTNRCSKVEITDQKGVVS